MMVHVLLCTLFSSLCISNCCCCCCCSSEEFVGDDGDLATVPFKCSWSVWRLLGGFLPDGPSDRAELLRVGDNGNPRGDVLGDRGLINSPVFSSTGIVVDKARKLFRFSVSDAERKLIVSCDSRCLSFARSFLFSSSMSEILKEREKNSI